VAKRFGEFTLLEELGTSESGERFRAMHDTLGGPFFVKRFSKLDTTFFDDLNQRCEALMTTKHPALAPHLGHGEIDGMPFAVSPWLEGIDLITFRESLLDRRVSLGYDALLYILRRVAEAVATLHGVGQFLSHGDVTARHIRVGPEGEVWLTGLPTPRGLRPGQPADLVWDGAGVAATVYDLIGLTRPGQSRPSLPTVLDRLVRRGLGIGRPDDRLDAQGLAEGFDEVAEALKVAPSQEALKALSARTLRAVGRSAARRATGADDLPTLEPIGGPTTRTAAAPAAIDLQPIRDDSASLIEARTETVTRPPVPAEPQLPIRQAPPPATPPLAAVAPERTPPIETPPAIPPALASLPDRARPSGPVTSPVIQRPPEAPGPGDDGMPFHSPATQPMKRSLLSDETEEVTMRQAPPDVAEPPGAPAPEVPREITALMMNPLVARSDEGDDPGAGFADEETTPELHVPASAGDDSALPAPRLASELPPDISLDSETTELERPPGAEPPPAISSEMGGLGSLISDGPSRGPLLADPDAPADTVDGIADPPPALDEPTRELEIQPKHSVTASAEGNPFADDTDASGAAAMEASASPADPAPADPSPAERPAVEALLRSGHITAAQVSVAVAEQAARGGRLIEIIIGQNALKDGAVADILAEDAVRPRISDAGLMRFLPDRALLKRLPQTFAIDRRLLPLAIRDGGQLVMAVSDPYGDASIDEVQQIYAAASVEVHVAAIGALKKAIAEAYRPAAGAHADEEYAVLLCVADDALVAKLGARFVEEGFAIEHAATGPVAKGLLERHQPDAVVCAADLAGADGCEVLLAARADDRLAEMPFFVIGPDDEELESRVLDLGGDDYFDLPLNVNVVVKKLRRALAKRPPKKPATADIPPAIDFDAPTVRNTALPPGPGASPLDDADLPFQFDDLAMSEDASDDFGANMAGGAAVPEEPDDFAEPTGVMGTLRQMAVSEIVQSLELGRKTARVELVPTEGLKGSFSFLDGQVVYATCDGKLGEDAFFELAKAQEGFFRIHYGDAPAEKNIEKPTTFLLLEAMRRIDEEAA
jgi:DNA-binding response OmpR family regulator